VIFGLLIAAASVAGYLALVSNDQDTLSALVLIGGLGLAFAVFWVSQWVALGWSVLRWVGIVRKKPGKVTVRSVHPPKGFIFRRDAVVTMEVENKGTHELLEQGIPIPFLPAFIWRVLGKVPTPIGRLTDKRDLNAKVWDRDEPERRPGRSFWEAKGKARSD
jgi:hypothetical protein